MHRTSIRMALATGISLLCACNALDTPPDPELEPGDRVRVVPLDTRAPVQADQPPPPIIGGTLAVAHDGELAVAADPARDRISIVALEPLRVAHTLSLRPGDRPGRVAIDPFGHQAHVVLRGGAAVATVDLDDGTLVDRREVCNAPRGIAFDGALDAVHVACLSGELVTLPADGGESSARHHIASDLRDVVLDEDEALWLTRFKSAEMLRVRASDGHVLTRLSPPSAHRPNATSPDGQAQEAAVAWRAVPLRQSDGAVMLHQRASTAEIAVEPEPPDRNGPSTSPYGGSATSSIPQCDGILHSTISRVEGLTMHGGPAFAGPILPVDVAVSDDGNTLAIADAGSRDPDAPRVTFRTIGSNGSSGSSAPLAPSGNVHLIRRDDHERHSTDGCVRMQPVEAADGQATAVAFIPGSPQKLLVQLREPARLVLVDTFRADPEQTLDLRGETIADTGHSLFHRDSGGGIACASCHPEGGEDGHVWRFQGLGPRRTQSLQVGLEDTAPFHWDGTLPDLGSLMNEVFIGRMGGVRQSDARIEALSAWLFSLQPPPPAREASDPAVARGEAIFHDPDVGCAGCHAGPKLTDNRTVDVATTQDGSQLQVPSLVGIAHRAPFMHDGCAETLRERFDPQCGGGDAHGHTSNLDESQITDLVAYLESL